MVYQDPFRRRYGGGPRRVGFHHASRTSEYRPTPMRVAVLGGGPAGAFAAEKLASSGIPTTVFDVKLAWEKPCGGGLTWKAYSTYPFLKDSATQKKVVTESVLTAPGCPQAKLRLDHPILIYSRYELNGMLLD